MIRRQAVSTALKGLNNNAKGGLDDKGAGDENSKKESKLAV